MTERRRPWWQWMRTLASGSVPSTSAAKWAAGDQRCGDWARPESHIGAWTTFDGPRRARSIARSWENQVWAVARQLTMWVTHSALRVSTVGRVPIAMRSAPIQLRGADRRLGP